MKKINNPEQMLSLRKNTALHLLQNPNYFGTMQDKELVKKFSPVLQLPDKTYYEGLGCISYSPEKEKLDAVVMLKRETGYLGTACQGGSREYVRFYVDYQNNGTWIDEGVANVGVYDHNFPEHLCYNVELKISPKLRHCCDSSPVLPNVRAILSWNQVPPPNQPNWPPVWGDVKEARIQIAPRKDWLCLLNHIFDLHQIKADLPKLAQPQLLESIEASFPQLKTLKSLQSPELQVVELKNLYGKDVEDHRILNKAISLSQLNTIQLSAELSTISINWATVADFIANPKFNTTYEEVRCVSLNKDTSELHASVELKKESGYSGGLCTKGSQEYVAFYMDFGSGWKYMGTSSVNVHDMPGASKTDLWYDVALHVDLDKYRKEWCAVGKAKVKAILSWNVPPTPNDPNYVAYYGDWEECYVEIKPLPKGIAQGDKLPFIEKLGGMIVTDINTATGLATTSGGSSSLPGASQSPFDGRIDLVGHLFNIGAGSKYRLLLTEPGGTKGPLLSAQKIDTDYLGVITNHNMIPDADGWIDYLEVGGVNVVGDLLGAYYPAVEGKHKIAIEARDAANVIYAGNEITFMVDKKAPDVAIDITNGSGNCGVDFIPGDTLEGTYSINDAYPAAFSIYMTPDKPGTSVEIDGLPVSSMSLPLGITSRSGNWKLYTTAGVTPPCGYNIRIDATDRTIINSGGIGHYNAAIQGFCLSK